MLDLEKRYILDDEFDKIVLTQSEKDLIIQMDCKNLTIYETDSLTFQQILEKIQNGANVFLCKEGQTTIKCSIDMIKPMELEHITYDNEYYLYSYIIAETAETADKIFIERLELLNIYKNGKLINEVNIDKMLDNPINCFFKTTEIEITDKFPARTKMEHERSQEILKSIFK